MSIPYPRRPWEDGQQFTYTLATGEEVQGTYNASKNTWDFERYLDSDAIPIPITEVFTTTVQTVPIPFNANFGGVPQSPNKIQELNTQYDVNWFLADHVSQNQAHIDWLQQEISRFNRIFIGDGVPNNDINQWAFWYQPLTNEFYWWDEENQVWVEMDFGGGRNPIFSDTEPTEHPDYLAPDNELIVGDIWIDTSDPDELVEYIYNGTQWVKFNGDFVKRVGGDSMQGPLKVTGGRSPNADGIESTVETLNVDSGQNSSLNLKWNGATKVYVGDDQTSFQGDIKFNVGGRAIYAANDKKGFVVNDSGVFYDGAYTNDRHVATKKNVDEAIYHDILDTDTNKYVDRAGDSMSGPLVIDNTEIRFNNRSNGQTLIRASRNEAEFPMFLDLRHPGGSAEGGYDIKIQGNTAYNQLRFVGNDTYLTMNGGGGAKDRVMFNIDISLENNRIENLGRAVNDTDAVPYGQIEEELAEFRDELISNLTFGTWQYASGSSSPVVGRCYFRNALSQNSGISPNSITQMVFNEIDIRGAAGAFDRIDIGEIISLTNGAVTIKYRINSAAAVSGSSNEIRSFEVVYISQTGPIVYVDGVEWTFTLTEFTDISVDQLDDTYLRLDCSNDPLETELEIKTPDFGAAGLTLTGKRDNTNNATATIAFRNQNDTAEAYVGYLTYRTTGSANGWFRFNQDVDLNNNGLHSVARIRMQPGGYIGASSSPRLTFHNSNSGSEGDGLLVVPRPANSRRGFAIRGNDETGAERDMLYTFSNATGTPDAINYVGKMDSDTNLVNKAYVDDQMAELLAKIEELEMTSGTMESYQFRMNNKTTGGSSAIGSQMFINEIMSCDNDGDNWNGQNTHLLSSEYRHIYVCFEDGYRLNSTGQMSVVRYSNSNQYDIRNSNVATFNISGVEVCPPDKSSGKNIYRAVIQVDGYKPGTDAFYPSWGQGNVYVTFSGGSLTKTSA